LRDFPDAKELTDAGKKKEAADILDRLNFIYPVDGELHHKLGELWFDQGNAAGAAREFRAELAYKPIDAAQAHYDLALAYNAEHQPEKSKDELILALANDVEGEATCHYVTEHLPAAHAVKVSRIGFGLPSGGGVLYADAVTLKSALDGRRHYA